MNIQVYITRQDTSERAADFDLRSVSVSTLSVRSHVGWRGESSISCKVVETSP